MAINVTHVRGRHTFKAGAYLNHSLKAQNVGAGGVANLSFQGYVNFGNDSTNSLDSGFGYANAALGSSRRTCSSRSSSKATCFTTSWSSSFRTPGR